MPDTLTTFFGFTKPALHSTGWGPKANTDFDQWDSVLGIPRAAFKAPTVAATTILDLAVGSAFTFTLNQDLAIQINTPAANPSGVSTQVWQKLLLVMVGDGTRRAVTWPGSITWLTGQVPVLTPSRSDFIELFTKDNGITWLGVHHGVIDLPSVTVDTYVGSGTTNIDLATGRFHKVTVAGAISTIAFTNWTKNVPKFTLLVVNGGSQVLTWPGSVTWLAGSVPVLQVAGTDELEFFTPDGGVTWFGARVGIPFTAPRVKATKSTDTICSVGSDTAIAFDGADEYDSQNLHDPASNNTRITIPVGFPTAEVELAAEVIMATILGQSDVNVSIRKNGTTILGKTRLILPSGGTFDTGSDGLTVYPFQVVAYDNAPIATDYYEVLVKLTGGSNHNATSGSWFRAKVV